MNLIHMPWTINRPWQADGPKVKGTGRRWEQRLRLPRVCSCLVNPGEESRLASKIGPQVPDSISQYTTTVQVCHRAGVSLCHWQVCHRAGVSTAKYSFQMHMGKRVYVRGRHQWSWYFFEDQDSLQITFTCEETVIRLSGLLIKQEH